MTAPKVDFGKLHTLNEAEIEEILYRHGKSHGSDALAAMMLLTFYGIAIGLFLGWWVWV